MGSEVAARPFWPALSEPERRALSGLAERGTFEAGDVLCREGDPAVRVIVVLAGWTKVSLAPGGGGGGGGRERIIALRGPGDLVGERAALRVRSRSATVVALDTVEALIVPAVDFAVFLDGHERVYELLERQLYGRLTEERYGETAPEERIAGRLAGLVLPRGHRLTLPVTCQDIADFTDVPDADVEQIMAVWERSGLVRVTPHSLTVLDAHALQGSTAPPARYDWGGQNCSVLFTDVARFSDPSRDDRDRLLVRQVLYETLRRAFGDAGLDWDLVYREDRGDGTLMVVPPSVPTASLVDPLLRHLAAGVDRHNRDAAEAVRVQLRVALHVGPVVPDGNGVAGEAVIRTARLLDAPAFKKELEATGADLGFIASRFVYDSAVRHSTDPAPYREVEVQVKETETTAWMYFAHGARPLHLREQAVRSSSRNAQATGTGAGTVFAGPVDVAGDLVLGDKIQYDH
ncbi:cyclic nucleotide-binding domain-containing protein [Actinomadura sp. 21ATH]|uniref:cyclic nucleotide-binding domain-containing protein n=1 Tax=Actinomadura sp. 21ATH TaxID=1735444 RepID=UPI0035BF3A1D